MKEFKSDNEFDKLFQDTLREDSVPTSDNVWEKIESRLDNESNKPKFIFWLSLFIGIVLIGTISFLALEKPKPIASINQSFAKNSNGEVKPDTDQSTVSADKKPTAVSDSNLLNEKNNSVDTKDISNVSNTKE